MVDLWEPNKAACMAITNHSFRLVSLTFICSKLFEHIAYSHIYSHLSNFNILCDEQHEFCWVVKILWIPASVNHGFAVNSSNKGQIDDVSLNFCDEVSPQRVCHKLHHYVRKIAYSPYLGMIIDFKLSLSKEIHKITNKAGLYLHSCPISC